MNIKQLNDVSGEARELLSKAQQAYGFIPNLLGVLANAPSALKAYMTLNGIFDETSLSPTERQIVLLTVSFENECSYCMAAHSAIATMQKVDSEIVSALRRGQPIVDDKLEALRLFTQEVVSSRGWPSEETKCRFLEAGYEPSVMLEVVLGVSLKTLSNYSNHLADIELDANFKKMAWSKSSCENGSCKCS
ncbi:MAG: carboxymuconolactone decarboxylase family protein [bacterium]|nr:carboxymuconolactone decarboxylase family protein [bacterium]